jgi:rhodanese-related sulfurtransferase
MKSQILDGIPTIYCEDLKESVSNVSLALKEGPMLIDVRRPDEFNGELGHIEGSQLYTLGAELTEFLESLKKDEEVIFICRSGARSGQATLMARELGIQNTYNLGGGMIRWNALKYPILRD